MTRFPHDPPPAGAAASRDQNGQVAAFAGRSVPDPAIFEPTPLFAENFPTLAAEGEMFAADGSGQGAYAHWNAYPPEFLSTDRLGYYDPARASVVPTAEGGTALQLRLVPAAGNPTASRPSGVCVQAAPGGKPLSTVGEKVEGRFRLLVAGPGGYLVPMGWPPRDADWPADGELDYAEIRTDPDATVRGFLHVHNGGTHGQGQVELISEVPASSWFTAGFERIPGQCFRWTVNGQVITTVAEADLVAPHGIPRNAFRFPIQFEPSGTAQTHDLIVLVDWWTIWTLR